MTFGYTPVMIEHLFDEALVWALRDRRDAMDWRDVATGEDDEEIGLKQPVEYTDEEKAIISTHEAGHAVVAHLVARTQARSAVDHQSAATRSACSRTPTTKSATRVPVPSSSAR